MIRIAVVDDVCEVCTQLEKYLLQLSDKYNQEIEVEPFHSGKSICDALKKHDSYDLIFLDIELDQISGIDVGKFIRDTLEDELQLLVYISANSQYSLQLHQMHPLGQHRINSDKEKGHPVQKLNAQKYVHFSFAGRTGSDRQRFPVSQIQIRQCEHDIQFGGLFSQTPISCFSISKQSFDDGKNMFNFASYG